MDKSGLALFSQELQQEVASLPLPECKKVYYGKMYSGLNGVLSAEHNRANAQAASLAVEFFGITEKQVRAALSTFVPAAYRYEKFLAARQHLAGRRVVCWVAEPYRNIE